MRDRCYSFASSGSETVLNDEDQEGVFFPSSEIEEGEKRNKDEVNYERNGPDSHSQSAAQHHGQIHFSENGDIEETQIVVIPETFVPGNDADDSLGANDNYFPSQQQSEAESSSQLVIPETLAEQEEGSEFKIIPETLPPAIDNSVPQCVVPETLPETLQWQWQAAESQCVVPETLPARKDLLASQRSLVVPETLPSRYDLASQLYVPETLLAREDLASSQSLVAPETLPSRYDLASQLYVPETLPPARDDLASSQLVIPETLPPMDNSASQMIIIPETLTSMGDDSASQLVIPETLLDDDKQHIIPNLSHLLLESSNDVSSKSTTPRSEMLTNLTLKEVTKGSNAGSKTQSDTTLNEVAVEEQKSHTIVFESRPSHSQLVVPETLDANVDLLSQKGDHLCATKVQDSKYDRAGNISVYTNAETTSYHIVVPETNPLALQSMESASQAACHAGGSTYNGDISSDDETTASCPVVPETLCDVLNNGAKQEHYSSTHTTRNICQHSHQNFPKKNDISSDVAVGSSSLQRKRKRNNASMEKSQPVTTSCHGDKSAILVFSDCTTTESKRSSDACRPTHYTLDRLDSLSMHGDRDDGGSLLVSPELGIPNAKRKRGAASSEKGVAESRRRIPTPEHHEEVDDSSNLEDHGPNNGLVMERKKKRHSTSANKKDASTAASSGRRSLSPLFRPVARGLEKRMKQKTLFQAFGIQPRKKDVAI
jgi:hypothetical protein